MANVADKPGLDPTLPKVALRVGAVDHFLCFDFNAIVQAEAATGINLLTAVVSDLDATKLRGLLWSALLRDSPETTLEQAGAMITPRNIGVVHAAIIAAWFGSITEDEPSKEPTARPKPKARRSTKA